MIGANISKIKNVLNTEMQKAKKEIDSVASQLQPIQDTQQTSGASLNSLVQRYAENVKIINKMNDSIKKTDINDLNSEFMSIIKQFQGLLSDIQQQESAAVQQIESVFPSFNAAVSALQSQVADLEANCV